MTARRWWSYWGGYLLFAIALEMVVSDGMANAQGAPWIYYGHQAFVLFGVPFFTPWTYVSIDVAIATGVLALVHFLPRRQQWLILPAVPMLMVCGHAMTALPSALALNSTDDPLLLHLGALGSGAFALLLSYACSLAFRRPWAPASRSDAERSGLASTAA